MDYPPTNIAHNKKKPKKLQEINSKTTDIINVFINVYKYEKKPNSNEK